MNARNLDEPWRSIGLLILRVGVGGYMLTHGWGKLQMLTSGEPFPADPLGLGSSLSLWLITFAEFGCALLVVLGVATRLAALPLVFAMGVAAFIAHRDDPWMMTGLAPSKEPAMLYLFPFLALVFLGPGRFSVDAWLWPRLRRTGSKPAETPAA